MTSKIKTRVLIISDTHASLPKHEKLTKYAFRHPLPQADVAIHCGDLTMNGTIDQHEAAIALLKSIDAEIKVVIPGNHDLTLDTRYYEKSGHVYGPRPKYNQEQLQQIRDLYIGSEAKDAGIHYFEEGIHNLQLKNNAEITLYASAYTPEFCGWSFAYELWEDRYNSSAAANPMPTFDSDTPLEHSQKNVDIVVTHGPPHTILDKTTRNENVGCPHLLTAVSRCRPLLHCFGHIHEGWGAVRKSWSSSIDNSTISSSANLLSERVDEKVRVERVRKLKEDQKSSWDRDHARDNGEIDVDQKLIMKDRGAYINATTLKHGDETVFVNASIMSSDYEPLQASWLVDLMLNPKE